MHELARAPVTERISSLNAALAGIAATGAAAAIGAVTSAIGAMRDAIGGALERAASLTQATAMFGALTDATAEQVAAFSAKARELAADITLPGVTARTAADAMLELARAGVSVEDTISASRGVLLLANAAQIDAASAAEITARALNAFGLSGREATRVADVMARTANISSGSITDIAYALQSVSAVARAAGLSLEETNAAIATLSNAGIAGSDAGTSLRTMLMRLQAPTKEAQRLLREMGVAVFDASGQMRRFPDIVREIANAAARLNDQARADVFAELFGSDAIRAAQILTREIDGYVSAVDDLAQKASGSAARLGEAAMSGLIGAREGLSNAVDSLLLALGSRIEQPVAEIITRIAQVLSSSELTAFVSGVGQAMADALSGAQSLFGRMSSSAGTVGAAIGGVRDAVMGVVRSVAERLAPVFAEFLPRLEQAWARVRVAFEGFLQRLGASGPQAQSILSSILALLPPLIEAFLRLAEVILNGLAAAFQVLGPAVQVALQIVERFAAILSGVVAPVIEHVSRLISSFIGLLQSAMGQWAQSEMLRAQAMGFALPQASAQPVMQTTTANNITIQYYRTPAQQQPLAQDVRTVRRLMGR